MRRRREQNADGWKSPIFALGLGSAYGNDVVECALETDEPGSSTHVVWSYDGSIRVGAASGDRALWIPRHQGPGNAHNET